jgi:hypothetical protein
VGEPCGWLVVSLIFGSPGIGLVGSEWTVTFA